MRYTEQEQRDDQEKLAAAFEALDAIRSQFGAVIKVYAITIHDIALCRMRGRFGAKLAKDIYSRAELLYALSVAEQSPCADLEEMIYLAVQDYRQTHATPLKEE